MQGVGFRPYVHRLAGELGLAGLRAERRARRADRGGGGARTALRATSSERLAGRGAAARPGRARAHRGARAHRRERVRDPGEPSRGASPTRGCPPTRPPARTAWRALRPRRPPPPLPVHQLHQLRPALHDRARRALRPAAHHDGRLPDVRALPRPSTTTPPTGASTPQPNACPDCGPRLRLGDGVTGDAALRGRGGRAAPRARVRGREGRWAVTTWPAAPSLEPAVAALRARKRREDRPFALMAPSLEAARELVELSPDDERLLAGPRAADRDRAAPRRARRWRSRWRPRSARPRRDAALLAAPPPAARGRRRHARDDERERVRRADRLRGRGRARAAGRHRGRSSWRTTGRSTCAPTTRWCAPPARGPLLLRRSRGLRAREPRAARAEAPPLLACGAELKSTFCVAKGALGLGGAPHRRPAQLGDPAARSARASSTSSACSRWRPSWWRTICIPTTSPPATRWSARACAHVGGPAPPRPPGRLPGRARRDAARPWARSTTAPATAATAPPGEGSCWWAAWWTSSAPGCCCPCACPAATARPTEPWRMACAWLAAGAWTASRRCRRTVAVDDAAGERWPRWRVKGTGVAAHHQRRAGCSTPWRRCAACARR